MNRSFCQAPDNRPKCPACPHPGREWRTARRPTNRSGSDPRRIARCLRPTATSRSCGKAGSATFPTRPSAGTADSNSCAGSAPQGRRLPCLSDARSGHPTVRRFGRDRRGPAHPDCGRPLSGGPFADRARDVA